MRYVTLALLGACATSPEGRRLADGRRVTYESQPSQCIQRCDSICEYVCEPQLSVQRILPSCRAQCAGSESEADCITECEQPPFVCGNAPGPPSRSTQIVVTTLAVIGFSVVGLFAADQALGR